MATMKFDKHNEENRELFRRLYIDEDKSLFEISKVLGMSKSSVAMINKFFGFKKQEKSDILTKEFLEENWLKQGKSLSELEQDTGIKKSTISNKVNKYNLQRNEFQLSSMKTKTQSKRESTNLQKYGYTNPMQNKEIQEKGKATNLIEYGCENPFQNDKIKSKIKNTCLDRYGVEHIRQSKECKESIKKTNMEKYGVECYFETQRFKDQSKSTCLDRYGAEHASQNEEVKAKIVSTNQARYGATHYCQTQQYKDGWAKRDGRTVCGRDKWSDETYKVLNSKENMENFIKTLKGVSIIEIAEALQVSLTTISKRIEKFDLKHLIPRCESEPEHVIKEFLDNLNINNIKSREIIYPYEIDFLCKEYNIGIEFNGNYWHREDLVGKNYHILKSHLAQEKDIFLYHIFEYEWSNPIQQKKIKNQLRNLFGQNEYTIYARKCDIREISSKEKDLFLEDNHVQGIDKSSVKLGLYYNNELVSLMTFCKPRFNKKYLWELSRFCSKANTNVVGGASKLFKYFRKHYEGSIVSYSDIAKTKGTLYEKLGFNLLRESKPNYVWVKGQDIKTRYQCQMKKEKQIMTEQGYFRVFDCGNKVWIIE